MTRRYTPNDWFTKAIKKVHELTMKSIYLTADDLREAMDEEPKHFNDWGAAMNAAQVLGLVIKTGRFVQARHSKAKGRNVQLWESAYLRRETPDPDPVAVYLESQRSTMQGSLL